MVTPPPTERLRFRLYESSDVDAVSEVFADEEAIDRIETTARRNLKEGDAQATPVLARTGGIGKYDRRREWWIRHHDKFAASLS